MCKIRIIRRVSETAVNSSVIDFQNININPIDRPAYVVYVKKDLTHGLSFLYSSDKEPKQVVLTADVYIEYGVNSGRIYSAILKKDLINQTDAFSLLNEANKGEKTERFLDNFKTFISAVNQTILYVLQNPINK